MLTALSAAVAEQKTVNSSVITLLNGVADKIAGVSPNKAALDALADELRASTAALAEAAAVHTAAEDEPVE